LEGVFTAMNTMSAEAMAGSTAVETWRLPPAATHHFGQAGFDDGWLAEIGIIPGGDALGVEVSDRHLDLEAAIGDFL
jgi:hypothetical protein